MHEESLIDPELVLAFWFQELTPADWWRKNPELDQHIRDRFLQVHQAAVKGECYTWRASARGRLAEIIVLDQFSRNIYRDSAGAFSADGIALVLAQEAVSSQIDKQMTVHEKLFLYLPYMHSESLKIHDQAVVLFNQPGLEKNLDFEHKHKIIIERFSRYPHRNALLGRTSTEEELQFLQTPGSSF